jgi:pantoate--beta-alanine ligase
MKLFLEIKPDFAVFGKKDYQQLLVVSALAKSLEIGIEVVGVETVRNADGVALSSRNNYFTEEDRSKISFIATILKETKGKISNNVSIDIAIMQAEESLKQHGVEKIDYLEVRTSKTLELVTNTAKEKAILFFAGFYKNVRLIDNIEFF